MTVELSETPSDSLLIFLICASRQSDESDEILSYSAMKSLSLRVRVRNLLTLFPLLFCLTLSNKKRQHQASLLLRKVYKKKYGMLLLLHNQQTQLLSLCDSIGNRVAHRNNELAFSHIFLSFCFPSSGICL